MNYDYYRIFYYVGKHKNITRAAVELYSSQPAITRAIQNLEAELGCRLFTRTKTGVEFTHEGKTLYEYVSVAHRQLLKGEDEVSNSINVESGTIYIGASVTALHDYLFDVLDAFHGKYPGVKFNISTGSNNGTVEKLKGGFVDLAFVSTPCNTSKSLHSVEVSEFNDVLIAGNGFAELKNRQLELDEVGNFPFVCLRNNMQLREFIDEFFAENGIALKPDIETDTADLIVPMVAHNFGLGFVPHGIAKRAIKRGDVFRVKLKKELPARHICMITDPRHPQTNASRELYKMITR